MSEQTIKIDENFKTAIMLLLHAATNAVNQDHDAGYPDEQLSDLLEEIEANLANKILEMNLMEPEQIGIDIQLLQEENLI